MQEIIYAEKADYAKRFWQKYFLPEPIGVK